MSEFFLKQHHNHASSHEATTTLAAQKRSRSYQRGFINQSSSPQSIKKLYSNQTEGLNEYAIPQQPVTSEFSIAGNH
jgi:hypothetical protein